MKYQSLFKLARSKGYELHFMVDGNVLKLSGYLENEITMELAGIQNWLRQKHKISVHVDYFNENVEKLRWTWRIDYLKKVKRVMGWLSVDHKHATRKSGNELHYETYEQALIEGINYVLKNNFK